MHSYSKGEKFDSNWEILLHEFNTKIKQRTLNKLDNLMQGWLDKPRIRNKVIGVSFMLPVNFISFAIHYIHLLYVLKQYKFILPPSQEIYQPCQSLKWVGK